MWLFTTAVKADLCLFTCPVLFHSVFNGSGVWHAYILYTCTDTVRDETSCNWHLAHFWPCHLSDVVVLDKCKLPELGTWDLHWRLGDEGVYTRPLFCLFSCKIYECENVDIYSRAKNWLPSDALLFTHMITRVIMPQDCTLFDLAERSKKDLNIITVLVKGKISWNPGDDLHFIKKYILWI